MLSEVPRSTEVAAVRIPADMETLRGDDAELATRWRMAQRDAMAGLLADGWEVNGFLKQGVYLFTHPDDGDFAEDEISTAEEAGPRD